MNSWFVVGDNTNGWFDVLDKGLLWAVFANDAWLWVLDSNKATPFNSKSDAQDFASHIQKTFALKTTVYSSNTLSDPIADYDRAMRGI